MDEMIRVLPEPWFGIIFACGITLILILISLAIVTVFTVLSKLKRKKRR